MKPKKNKEKKDACDSCDDHKEHHNPDHSKEFNRLNRIIGQLEGIKKMIENRSYCPNILIQTKAVRSALKSLESSILERHIEHCVTDAFNTSNKKDVSTKIEELIEIFNKMGH